MNVINLTKTEPYDTKHIKSLIASDNLRAALWHAKVNWGSPFDSLLTEYDSIQNSDKSNEEKHTEIYSAKKFGDTKDGVQWRTLQALDKV